MKTVATYLGLLALMLMIGAGAVALWNAQPAPYRTERKAQLELSIEDYLHDNKDAGDDEKAQRILELVDGYEG